MARNPEAEGMRRHDRALWNRRREQFPDDPRVVHHFAGSAGGGTSSSRACSASTASSCRCVLSSSR